MKQNDVMWVVMGSTPQRHDEDEYPEGNIKWVACVTASEAKANNVANFLNLKSKEIIQKVIIEYNKEKYIKNKFEEDQEWDGLYSQRHHYLEIDNKIEEAMELYDEYCICTVQTIYYYITRTIYCD